MSQISEVCFSCKKFSQQMLMLSCIHDPCLNCAASTFAQQIYVRKDPSDIYICQFCKKHTELDGQTTTELSSLARNYVKVPSTKVKEKQPRKYTPTKNRNHSPLNSKKKQPISAAAAKTTYFCKQHTDEQISYYCFGCQVNICPQCAIHGKHKDHNVKLIKKALAEVKNDYMNITNEVSSSQNTMAKYKDAFLKIIKDSNERASKDKNFIVGQFQIVRESLGIKQKQIVKKIEEMNKHNVQMLTSFLQIINFQHQEVAKIKTNVEGILRKDEVTIFEQYKQVGNLQQKIKQIRRKTDEVSGQLLFLHTEDVQKQISNINDLIIRTKQSIEKQYVGSAPQQTSRQSSRIKNMQLNHSNIQQQRQRQRESRKKSSRAIQQQHQQLQISQNIQ